MAHYHLISCAQADPVLEGLPSYLITIAAALLCPTLSVAGLCRLNASHKAAERYVSQFPSPLLSSIAKFIAFIAGSFAALLLFLALMDDTLLERPLYGRNLVWYVLSPPYYVHTC